MKTFKEFTNINEDKNQEVNLFNVNELELDRHINTRDLEASLELKIDLNKNIQYLVIEGNEFLDDLFAQHYLIKVKPKIAKLKVDVETKVMEILEKHNRMIVDEISAYFGKIRKV